MNLLLNFLNIISLITYSSILIILLLNRFRFKRNWETFLLLLICCLTLENTMLLLRDFIFAKNPDTNPLSLMMYYPSVIMFLIFINIYILFIHSLRKTALGKGKPVFMIVCSLTMLVSTGILPFIPGNELLQKVFHSTALFSSSALVAALGFFILKKSEKDREMFYFRGRNFLVYCVFSAFFIVHSLKLISPSLFIIYLENIMQSVLLFLFGISILIHYIIKHYRDSQNREQLHPVEDFYREFQITKREREIIELVCMGQNSDRIAGKLFISLKTVNAHFCNIYRKCGVGNRFELILLIQRYQHQLFIPSKQQIS